MSTQRKLYSIRQWSRAAENRDTEWTEEGQIARRGKKKKKKIVEILINITNICILTLI